MDLLKTIFANIIDVCMLFCWYIPRHIIHIFCVTCSILALILNNILMLFSERPPMYIEYHYYKDDDFIYMEEEGFSEWFILTTIYTTNCINDFHMWLVDLICGEDPENPA